MNRSAFRRLVCVLTLVVMLIGLTTTGFPAEADSPSMHIGLRVTQQYDKVYLDGYVSSASAPISKLEFDILYDTEPVRFSTGSGSNYLSSFDCSIGEIQGQGIIHVSFASDSAHEVSGDIFSCELSQRPGVYGTTTIRIANCVAYTPTADGGSTAFYPSSASPVTLQIGTPPEEDTTPVETEPETQPETEPATVPETTVPETTVPETTVPATQPDPTAPPTQATQPTTPATQPPVPTTGSGNKQDPTPTTLPPATDTTEVPETTEASVETANTVTAPDTDPPPQPTASEITEPPAPSATDAPASDEAPGIPWAAALAVIVLAAAGCAAYILYRKKNAK